VKAGRRGRRAGSTDTRAVILAAARRLFAEHGFNGTSLRQVARTAGVDPALVHHYFDGKEGLFAASVELPADPRKVLAEVIASPPAVRSELLVGALLRLWEGPAQPAVLALVRSAIGHERQAALMREVFTRRMLPLITSGLPGDEEEVHLRGSLVASTLMGCMVGRYVLRMEPLASLSSAEIVRLISPAVQRYLTGDLDVGGSGNTDTGRGWSGDGLEQHGGERPDLPETN
jgi:AcrR family transcriptional regulator